MSSCASSPLSADGMVKLAHTGILEVNVKLSRLKVTVLTCWCFLSPIHVHLRHAWRAYGGHCTCAGWDLLWDAIKQKVSCSIWKKIQISLVEVLIVCWILLEFLHLFWFCKFSFTLWPKNQAEISLTVQACETRQQQQDAWSHSAGTKIDNHPGTRICRWKADWAGEISLLLPNLAPAASHSVYLHFPIALSYTKHVTWMYRSQWHH